MFEQANRIAATRGAETPRPTAATRAGAPASPAADAVPALDSPRDDQLAGMLARSLEQRAIGVGRVPRGRQLLQRATYIVQAGYMSGDMFGISAALVLDPSLRVLILKETDPRIIGTREEQSALYAAFYKASLHNSTGDPVDTRVKVVDVADTRSWYQALAPHNGTPPANKVTAVGLDSRNDVLKPAGYATTIVGVKYGAGAAQSQAAVGTAWTRGAATKGLSSNQMKAFLDSKGIEPGKKYALLWVRLSAKRKAGGAHPELDTSVEGVRNLRDAILAQTDRTPVIIGDRPTKTDVLDGAIDMIEFWNNPAFAAFSGPDKRVDARFAQLRLFCYMVQQKYDLVSIGMRSGAMEGPALLGVPTVYIEELNNQQHARMEKWLGKVPGWTQATVETLPTRTGRRVQSSGSGHGTSHGALDERYGDFVSAIGKKVNTGYWPTYNRLRTSYDADAADAAEAFIVASLRSMALPGVDSYDKYVRYETTHPAAAQLRALLSDWHNLYPAYDAFIQALAPSEGVIARLLHKRVADVQKALSSVRGAAKNNNVGLEDFVRAAASELGASTPLDPAVRRELATWRSLYNGKAGLTKGFDPTDIRDRIMTTPKLAQDRRDRAAREKAEREAAERENARLERERLERERLSTQPVTTPTTTPTPKRSQGQKRRDREKRRKAALAGGSATDPSKIVIGS